MHHDYVISIIEPMLKTFWQLEPYMYQ